MCYRHSLSLLVHMHLLHCRRKLCCPLSVKFTHRHIQPQGNVKRVFTFRQTQLGLVTHLCMASITPPHKSCTLGRRLGQDL